MTTIQATSTGRRRRLGIIGTAARVIVGIALVADVVRGQTQSTGLQPGDWALGLIGFPAILFAWQWWRARRNPARLQATGPVAIALNLLVFLALWQTPTYAPALSVTSDAALLFYGTSMLVAAYRGYAGCEALAITNWLLRRDDQIGCFLFFPIDYLERHRNR